MKTVSFKLPAELDAAISELARKRRSTRSAMVRLALEAFTKDRPRSVTSAAGDLVGCIKGPGDLATNPRHMAGFGK